MHLKAEAGGVLLGELPQRLFDGLAQEPELDTAEATTTFTFRNSFDHLLRGIRLGELIPWKLAPTPDPCLRVRQRVNISQLVTQTLRDHVDFFFVLEDDPLVSSSWVEGRVDFSTLNITPQALWDATYGALGMVLHVQPRGQGLQLVGRWPQPTEEVTGGARIDADWRLTELPQRQWWQTPTRLTVRGADHVTELTPALLLEWVGEDDPAYPEVMRAVLPTQEWYDEPAPNGTTTVYRGFNKLNGQLTRQVEFTVGDVFVKETIDGKPKSKLFRDVATGYKSTETHYDPDCPARPVYQRVETRSWAYPYHVTLGTFQVLGPGIIRPLTVGEEAESGVTTTTYRYSPQGHLAAETTTGPVLMSVQQENAEAEADERGPIERREAVMRTVTQTWAYLGGGRWQHTPAPVGRPWCRCTTKTPARLYARWPSRAAPPTRRA
ncbi:hypothetical protein [Deinococcus multiflagellatus]|uniref:YD repeat protein n=1 Tax=Deinococcus multiflagellatus TaxID=1656887 RepID=A0ABW1ZI96_9DEIO